MACPFVRKAAGKARRAAEAAMRVWVEESEVQIVMIQEPHPKIASWNGWRRHRSSVTSKTRTWVKADIKSKLDKSLSDNNAT